MNTKDVEKLNRQDKRILIGVQIEFDCAAPHFKAIYRRLFRVLNYEDKLVSFEKLEIGRPIYIHKEQGLRTSVELANLANKVLIGMICARDEDD